MTKKTRREIDAALSANIALEAVCDQATVAELAHRYEVHQIYARKKRLVEQAACAFDADVSAVADLARRVTSLVCASGVSRTVVVERDAAVNSFPDHGGAGLRRPAIATFALGLDADATAVRAAPTHPGAADKPQARSITSNLSNGRATDERASTCSSAAWLSPRDRGKVSKNHIECEPSTLTRHQPWKLNAAGCERSSAFETPMSSTESDLEM